MSQSDGLEEPFLSIDEIATLVTNARREALHEMALGLSHAMDAPIAGALRVLENLPTRLPESLEKDAIKIEILASLQAMHRISRVADALREIGQAPDDASKRPLSSEEIVEPVLALWRDRLAAGKVEFRSPAPRPERLVHGSRPALSRSVHELMSNAYRAAVARPNPWIALQIENRPNTVRVAVADSGEGVHRMIRERIFEPFFTTSRQHGSTGLGLSAARGVAENHRGRLFLDESCPNTRFVLELPRLDGSRA